MITNFKQLAEKLTIEELGDLLDKIRLETLEHITTGVIDLHYWTNQTSKDAQDAKFIQGKQREYSRYLEIKSEMLKNIEEHIKSINSLYDQK